MDKETKEYLDKICRRQDKILHMLTVVLKAMHLLPVTEKEEKAIQIAQRKNAGLIQKVNDDLNKMTNTVDTTVPSLDISSLLDDKSVYDGVLGEDILKKEEGGK